jgi:hypothetical protein
LGQNDEVELHGVVIDLNLLEVQKPRVASRVMLKFAERDWQIEARGVGRKSFICTTQLLVVPEGQPE